VRHVVSISRRITLPGPALTVENWRKLVCAVGNLGDPDEREECKARVTE